ncbi:MAG: DUF397 domain-containing protein [Umezawaea sp.]
MWRKSSRSQAQGQCVELAVVDLGVGIRDSKNRVAGTLAFGRSAFAAFLDGVKADRHDLS